MKAFFTLHFSLFTLYCFAQTAPEIEWQNTIGAEKTDEPSIVLQTEDGGYFVAGTSNSNASGDKTEGPLKFDSYWVMKLNSNGDIIWQNTIGGNDVDVLSSAVHTTDGGYILGGWSDSNAGIDKTEDNSGGSEIWIVKINSIGNIEWDNTINASHYDILKSIIQTADGGYLLGAYSNSYAAYDKSEDSPGLFGNYDYWILKLDGTGAIEWDNTIGGDADETLRSVIQTADGGYLVGGFSASGISGDKTQTSKGQDDYWIVKLNTDGEIQWDKSFGGSDNDLLRSAIQTTDGGYLLGGYSESEMNDEKSESSLSSDYWVIKLSPDGTTEWENTIGGSYAEELNSILQVDNGYILAGFSGSGISGDKTEPCEGQYDYWLVKLNNAGELVWQKTIGGSAYDILQSVDNTLDNGFILAGRSSSNASGDKIENSQGGYDYWIIKLYPEENEPCEIAPADLFATNITIDKAKVNWDPDAGAIKYKVQYRAATSPAWINTSSTTNAKKLSGLSAATIYKYRVRSQCSPTLMSLWSEIEEFTTLPLRENVSGEWSMVNIYPNPNNGAFTIQFNNEADELIPISIKNMLGEEIYAEEINTSELNHTIALDKNIPEGIYLVYVKTNDKIFSQQIVITK